MTAFLITLLLATSVPSSEAVSEAPQPQWSKTYGPYRGWAMIQTSDGGYAIAGGYATYGLVVWVDTNHYLLKLILQEN